MEWWNILLLFSTWRTKPPGHISNALAIFHQITSCFHLHTNLPTSLLARSVAEEQNTTNQSVKQSDKKLLEAILTRGDRFFVKQ